MDPVQKEFWGAEQLARRMNTTRRSINTLRWKISKGLETRDRLPPPLNIGGWPKWDPDMVEEWIKSKAGTTQILIAPVSNVKIGRPRNTKPIFIKL